MKTDRSYLAKARKIWDATPRVKKAGQPTATRVGASTTLKKRKRPDAPGEPSVPRSPTAAPVPPPVTTALVTVQVVDLDDVEGPSSSATLVPVSTSQLAAPRPPPMPPLWKALPLLLRWPLLLFLRPLLLSSWHRPRLHLSIRLPQTRK